MRTDINKAASRYLKEILDERTQKLGTLAWHDLVYGPVTYCEDCGEDCLSDCTCAIKYPGFSAAVDEIRNALPSALYVEADTDFVSENEPQGYEDEETGEWREPEPYYCLDRKGVVAAAFGSDLAAYV